MRRLTPWERLEARLPDGFDPRWALAITAAAFAAGLVLAVSIARPSPEPSPPRLAASSPEQQLARLEAALAAKMHDNESQALELARLRARLAELEAMPPVASGPPVAAPIASAPPTAVARPLPAPALPELGFDEQALLATGVAPGEADRVREAWRRSEADKRALSERAAAEGWEHTYRHVRALRDLEAGLRRELDERAYDGLLYATGQPNRLEVREVIADSPAQRAGVRPGDRILRYDGARVFTSAELHAAATGGTGAPNVRLDLERAGTELSVVVPREPLGVLAKLTRDRPGPD